jgi:hypothetical protein
MSTDAINSAKIAMLIESNSEIKSMQVETNKNMNKLIEFQIRTEEHRINEKEWRERIESHNDKQDDRIDNNQRVSNDAKAQALSNGKWINVGVAVLTGIAIYIGKVIVDFITGS